MQKLSPEQLLERNEVMTRDVVFTMVDDKVLVWPLKQPNKSKGGIIIPETAQEKPQKAVVVQVGPGLMGNPMQLLPGDVVLYGKYAGAEIEVEDEDYLMMRQAEVHAILVPSPNRPQKEAVAGTTDPSGETGKVLEDSFNTANVKPVIDPSKVIKVDPVMIKEGEDLPRSFNAEANVVEQTDSFRDALATEHNPDEYRTKAQPASAQYGNPAWNNTGVEASVGMQNILDAVAKNSQFGKNPNDVKVIDTATGKEVTLNVVDGPTAPKGHWCDPTNENQPLGHS